MHRVGSPEKALLEHGSYCVLSPQDLKPENFLLATKEEASKKSREKGRSKKSSEMILRSANLH